MTEKSPGTQPIDSGNIRPPMGKTPAHLIPKKYVVKVGEVLRNRVVGKADLSSAGGAPARPGARFPAQNVS